MRAFMPPAPIQPVSVGVFAHTRGRRGQWILASVSEHGGREEWPSATGVVDAGKPAEFIAIIAEPRSASCDLISCCAQIKRVSRPDTRQINIIAHLWSVAATGDEDAGVDCERRGLDIRWTDTRSK